MDEKLYKKPLIGSQLRMCPIYMQGINKFTTKVTIFRFGELIFNIIK